MSTLTENHPPTPAAAGGRPSGEGERFAGQARDAYEHFVLFFEGLSNYYGDACAFVPRQAFDARLVLR